MPELRTSSASLHLPSTERLGLPNSRIFAERKHGRQEILPLFIHRLSQSLAIFNHVIGTHVVVGRSNAAVSRIVACT